MLVSAWDLYTASSLLLYCVTVDLANTLGQLKPNLQRADIYFVLGFAVWRQAEAPCDLLSPQIRAGR